MTTADGKAEGPFLHPQALCESAHVGNGTRVWAFAHVLSDARIGRDCNICDGVFVENDVVVGDRVTVKGGVQLWDGLRVGDDVFIGPNATLTNDLFPRSRQHVATYPVTVIEDGASLGANCTILPGRRVGRNAMVGAGAVVTKDVPPNAKVVGNPARIIGYVGADHSDATERPRSASPSVGVEGVSVIALPTHRDLRGDLTVAELAEHVPFEVRRVFLVSRVPGREVRGEHAHRRCHQLLVCVHGSLRLMVDDGTNRADVVLDHPSTAVHMAPGVWGTQYDYSPDAVLAVFASLPYDPDDYIRSYDDFMALNGPAGADPSGI